MALVLDAQVHVRGPNGLRTILIHDFFRDSFTTALEPTDLLTHVTIPIPQGQPKMAYRKLRHPASGYALVGVAAALDQSADGICSYARVAVTGAGRRAVRCKAAEAALEGQRLGPGTLAHAAEQAANGLDLLTDLYAGLEYRAQLVRTYARRALLDAMPAGRQA